MEAETTTKYAFDTEFAADGTILRDGRGARLSFTREEVQSECEKSYAEGRHDALVKTEEESATMLRQFTEQCTHIVSTLKTQSHETRSQAMELVLVAARKIAGAALERYPDEIVQNMVSDVLKELREVPRLVVTCTDGVSDNLEKKLQETVAHSDFEGALVIRRKQSAEPGDVCLEWAQGEVCINTNDIADRVENTVRHWLAATETQDIQRDLFIAEPVIEEG